jgi:2'-5' RNA ligase/GNAT superfamily N-acetyltransferase
MARQRLGVVLLVPQPLAAQIDGVRRALGDGARERIGPHVTLVPPVNVPERDLQGALAMVRRAAAAVAPITLTLGPVASFAPVNPTAYLRVDGAADQLAALLALRAGCLSGPLERTVQHEFVPHVTVADEITDARLEHAVGALVDFASDVTFDRVRVMQEQPGRIWAPIADAPLGTGPSVVGRGSLPLELQVSGRPDLEAAALLAVDTDQPGVPFAVTARREGVVVAAAWGWTANGWLEVADLVVAAAHRGQGIGRHLVAAVEDVAQRRQCQRAGIAAPTGGAAASMLQGAGWTLAASGVSSGAGHRRWERLLPEPDQG